MADKSPARAKGQAPRQKRRWFFFCWMRASAVFSQAIPFPPRLFAEREEDGAGRLNPGRFSLRRLPSCPGNFKAGPNHQAKWEMIQKTFLSLVIFSPAKQRPANAF